MTRTRLRVVSMVTVAMTLVALTTALTELDGKLNYVTVTLCMRETRVLVSPVYIFFVIIAA